MMAILMFLLLLQTPFGSAPPPTPPTQTPFGTAAPPVQPATPITTPFGPIPAAPPNVSEDVAYYIATLFYGADARTQITNTGTAMVFCVGKQQYFPSSIVTFLGTLSNLPQAGKPSTVKWLCAPSWSQVLAQLQLEVLAHLLVP